MASYQPGDRVHVAGFGKGIVREARNGGRYLVEIKGRAMETAASQLSAIDDVRPNTNVRRGRSSAFANASADRLDRSGSPDATSIGPPGVGPSVHHSPRVVITLDLHGRTVDEALGLLEASLNDALLADASELRVIHGRSGGRIKAAVHRRLGELPSVRKFRMDPQNAGVTIVSL